MKTYTTLGLFCLALFFQITLHGAEQPEGIVLDSSSKLILKSELSPVVPHQEVGGFKKMSEQIEILMVRGTDTYPLDHFEITSLKGIEEGVESPFSLLGATLDNKTLLYVYKFQSKVILGRAVLDDKGIFKKAGEQVLESGSHWAGVSFERKADGLLELSLIRNSGPALLLKQDQKNPGNFAKTGS